MVRSADVGDLDGDRPAHGDLGAQPRRARGASAPRLDDTDRIRHVAHLGVRTRGFAFAVHGLDAPAEEFRVDLAAPSGDVWSWGAEDAAQTRHRSALATSAGWSPSGVHRADTDLVATGADADRWLDIAQAFAGQPGEGRSPKRPPRPSDA